MDYEDTQNAAPDARESSKLASSNKNDIQSVTKRYFPFPRVQNISKKKSKLTGQDYKQN